MRVPGGRGDGRRKEALEAANREVDGDLDSDGDEDDVGMGDIDIEGPPAAMVDA